MLHTGTANVALEGRTRPTRWNLDSIGLLWGRLRHRNPEAFEAWLCDRDLTLVIAALLRLNDRQLKRIGMTRATLGLDVELLSLDVARRQRLGAEVLEIVGGTEALDAPPAANRSSAPHAVAVAAE